jgi:hypothetical protein
MKQKILLAALVMIVLSGTLAIATGAGTTETETETVDEPTDYSQNTCSGGCGLNTDQCQVTSCGCGCR